ncbi:uroporphyrinogen-III synthase [Erwinia sp. CPCC 100877]|nr:uroporphyrinogen-III synthase [Erwinia sp. CPCC 100877]
MKTILLTRLVEDNQAERLYFSNQGYQVLEIPLISLEKREWTNALEVLLKESEWVFLTSQHAATFLMQEASEEVLSAKKFAVIGAKTGQVLLQSGYKAIFQSPFPTKQQMFNAWTEHYPAPATIFYPKSNLADCKGEDDLKRAGYQLAAPILYDNVFTQESQQQLARCLETIALTAVYLASPSLWQRFLTIFNRSDLKQMPKLYCVGQTTASAIAEAGYSSCIRRI